MTVARSPADVSPQAVTDAVGRREPARARIILTGDEHAVGRQALHKGGEGGLNLGQIAKIVQVISLDARYDGHLGSEPEEAAVVLVGLHDHLRPMAKSHAR